jgi:uncharacterized repeat protein (TIGR03803 family)
LHTVTQTRRPAVPALAASVLCLLVSRSAAAGSVTLTWDPIAAPDVAGYIVCYGPAAEIYANCTAVGPVTTWSLSGLADGDQYHFAVQAYDSAGSSGPFSDDVTVVVNAPGGAQITSPNPGSGLPVSTAEFAWTAASPGSTYRLSIGTTFGASDVFDLDMSTSLRARVTGLPTTAGVAVYVRLWTFTNGEAFYADYSYLTAYPAVQVAEITAFPGTWITVIVTNGPAFPTDWVGLYPLGADNTMRVMWSYLNGLTNAPAVGLTTSTFRMLVPLATGRFELRLFSHNSFDRLATSGPITVETTPTGDASGGTYLWGGLARGPNDQIYGTAAFGGGTGRGAVFLADRGTGALTTVHNFEGPDGTSPYSTLTFAEGNIYGTTQLGGTNNAGTVFTMTPSGVLTTLHSFSGPDGAYPTAGVVRAADGRVYGVATYGGSNGHGTVYSIDATNTLTTLHEFTGADGGGPSGALVQVSDGSLYGTTSYGGQFSLGTVFRIDPAGTFQTVHEFSGPEGADPQAALIRASDGALYGTTTAGGSDGQGTVFKIDESGSIVKLHDFNEAYGSFPLGNLLEVGGTLYGTTADGGATSRGTIFSIDAQGNFVLRHHFSGADGAHPVGGLVAGNDGALYGATLEGGPGDGGVVFRLTPSTELSLAPAIGPYKGTTVLTATLTSNGAPVFDKTIVFLCNRVPVGSAATDISGVARLTGVSLAGLDLGAYAGLIAASVADPWLLAFRTADLTVTIALPTINWPTPAPIPFGTSLGPVQLNATANAPGTFVYSPPAGTLLRPGAAQPLSVAFTPTDTTRYTTAFATASIDVLKATPAIAWTRPMPILYGTPLGTSQFNPTANVPGTFEYAPPMGTVLKAGAAQPLIAVFTPADTGNYTTATATTTIDVLQLTPAVRWNTPADIVYGTALGGSQLNATADVPGTFRYSPLAGTVLAAGAQPLTVTFTPIDTNYATVIASTTITVLKATPRIRWNAPANLAYGFPLSPKQLDAQANVPGTYEYSPPAGTLLPVGAAQPLTVRFTPADTTNYVSATATVAITIVKATPKIKWNAPADLVYGTPLGAKQLDAKTNILGHFEYTPPAGTILPVGPLQLLTVTFTPDDTTNYAIASAGVAINVVKATPRIRWSAPAEIVYGTALGVIQLNAKADVAGSFEYSPPAGTVLPAGTAQLLTVLFTPADATNYATTIAIVAITVKTATPAITWHAPADIVYGSTLGTAQLNATASVPGTFEYSPPAGTVLNAGAAQHLAVTFTPTDASNYVTATASVAITVLRATPTITWVAPAVIVYGTPLGATQLNAAANVAGSFEYVPPAGALLNPGVAQPLTVTFTPVDAVNYATATASVLIDVRMAAPDAPGTPTPASGAADVAVSATLIWSDAAGATSYDVNWGTTDPPPAAMTGLTTTSWTPTLIAGTTYYWQVVARNGGGTSAGPVWSFTTVSDPGPAGDVLVMDSFSGAAGTLLTAHAAEVQPAETQWTLEAGAPRLQDGMVGVSEAGPVAIQATLDAGISDILAAVDYQAGVGPGVGALAFRLIDGDNHLLLKTNGNWLELYRRRSGRSTLVASSPLPHTLVSGTTHRLEVHADGPNIEGWWDGTCLLRVRDSFQQTATRHGLGWNTAEDPTSRYDNFVLSPASQLRISAPGPGGHRPRAAHRGRNVRSR